MDALLSLLALYNYDSTIFDNFSLPAGLDKQNVIDNLLAETAEFEILYPNPTTLKGLIEVWSKKELPVWEKEYATTKFSYDPLNNLYRDDTETDTETRDLNGTNNETRDLRGNNKETRELHGGNTRTLNNTDATTTSGTDTNKEYVSGFNETSANLAKQTDTQHGAGNSQSHTGTISDANTDNGTVETDTSDNGTIGRTMTDKGTVKHEHSTHSEGSIGVITPQQMTKQEREVSQFNIIDYITASFKKRFCILVY
jgi:hypothetical protein